MARGLTRVRAGDAKGRAYLSCMHAANQPLAGSQITQHPAASAPLASSAPPPPPGLLAGLLAVAATLRPGLPPLPALPPSSPPPSPRCPAISARLAMAEAPSPPPRVGGRPGAALAPRLPSTSQHGGPPCLPAPHAPRNRARPMQRAAPHTPSAPRPLATARGVAAGSAAAGGLLRGAGADPPAAGETLRARGGPGVRRGGGGQAALALAARPGDPPRLPWPALRCWISVWSAVGGCCISVSRSPCA